MEVVKKLRELFPGAKIKTREMKRYGTRIDVELSRPPSDPWFLKAFHEIKSSFPDESVRVFFSWRSGERKYRVAIPHNVYPLKVGPPRDWPHPYYPTNSTSSHETRGKYRILERHGFPPFNDDVYIYVNGVPSEVDLVHVKDGQTYVSEVINGKNLNPLDAITKKVEAVDRLRRTGFPVDKFILYVVPRSISFFKENLLSPVLELLRSYDLRGEVWIAGPMHKKIETRSA